MTHFELLGCDSTVARKGQTSCLKQQTQLSYRSTNVSSAVMNTAVCFIYNVAPRISREVTAIICGIVTCLGAGGGGGEMKLTPAAIFCGDLDTN